MKNRLSNKELNTYFYNDIKSFVVSCSSLNEKPILLDIDKPFRQLKVYLYNCTCPPGGRALDEFKIQLTLPGQARKSRGYLDDSDGRTILIVGYAAPFNEIADGVYIIWETEVHRTFAWSANLQIYLNAILETLIDEVVVCKKHGNNEIVILARRKNLRKAIEKRIEMDIQRLLE